MKNSYITIEDLPEIIEHLLESFGNSERYNLTISIESVSGQSVLTVSVADKSHISAPKFTRHYPILGEAANRHRVREAMEEGLKSMMKEVQS